MKRVKATIRLTLVCPACKYNLNELPYEHLTEMTCESCGVTLEVTYEAVTDAQHALLVALGETEPIPEPVPDACKDCHRTEEIRRGKIRPIALVAGVCAACRCAAAEVKA